MNRDYEQKLRSKISLLWTKWWESENPLTSLDRQEYYHAKGELYRSRVVLYTNFAKHARIKSLNSFEQVIENAESSFELSHLCFL